MKRWLLTILLFLLLGAVADLVVAWGCASWSPMLRGTSANRIIVGNEIPSVIPHELLSTASDAATMRLSSREDKGVGLRFRLYEFIEISDDGPANWVVANGVYGQVCAAGWPALSFSCHHKMSLMEAWTNNTILAKPMSLVWIGGLDPPQWVITRSFSSLHSDRFRRPLPFRPSSLGVAINTLFYAVLFWLPISGPFVLRRHIRKRRGRCVTCGYPAETSPTCTECGALLPARRQQA